MEGRREGKDSAEGFRVFHAGVEGDEPAHRGAADHGVRGVFQGPVIVVDVGLEAAFDEANVVVSLGILGIFPRRCVFVHPVGRVVDADDDGRLEPGRQPFFHRFVDLPFAGEGCRLVEEVLAVLHVDDRVALAARLVVARRVDADRPLEAGPEFRGIDVEDVEVADDGWLLGRVGVAEGGHHVIHFRRAGSSGGQGDDPVLDFAYPVAGFLDAEPDVFRAERGELDRPLVLDFEGQPLLGEGKGQAIMGIVDFGGEIILVGRIPAIEGRADRQVGSLFESGRDLDVENERFLFDGLLAGNGRLRNARAFFLIQRGTRARPFLGT